MFTFVENFFKDMKKFILALVFLPFLEACNSTPDTFTINGELRGDLKDSTLVFLKTPDSLRRSLIEIDTAIVTNGQFTFSGSAAIPQLHYILIDGIRSNAPVILENGVIRFNAHKDSLHLFNLKGTMQNQRFMEFMQESRTLASMSRSMTDEFRKANVAKDTATIAALREEYQELQERAKSFELDFIEQNPDALISVLVLEKLLASKTIDVQKVDSLFQKISEKIKATDPGKRLDNLLKKVKATAIGFKAPEFSGPTPDGGQLALNNIKGKVTLLDFWAAWCKPCRMENPNIVSVYEKYKDKGFQVVGISLDKTREKWLDAIEKDGLIWNHVSHLQHFQDPIAQLYNINAIPAAFLLDENGFIVAKNLRGNALEQKVAELLN